MSRKLGTVLQERARRRFVGREAELATLGSLLEAGEPRVVHLSGAAGIGKSTLSDAFATLARARGAAVVELDCRSVEPSVPGFLGALAAASGAGSATVEAIADRLAGLADRVVVVLDAYEHYWLMDTFIRQEVCPLLEEHVGLLLVGREGPVGAWLAAREWHGLFRSIVLGPLTEAESRAYLEAEGLEPAAARRVSAVAHGHPLALSVASGIRDWNVAGRVEDVVAGTVATVANEYVASIDDATTRRALECACVVRRATESLMRAMLPEAAPRDALDRLLALPFAETAADGVFVHEAVRDAVATTFRASDPERYRGVLVAAWRQLRLEVRTAPRADLWRYTADILYLLQNPILREAFFPSGYQPLAVEPATPDDHAAILDVAAPHDGPEGLAILEAWLGAHPDAFRVCRDADGMTTSFMTVIPGRRLDERVISIDPVAGAWMQDMRQTGGVGQSLLIRRLLDREFGEAPSAGRSALALDVKRHYMEMRPELRYIYVGGTKVDDFDWCYPLGFDQVEDEHPAIDARPFNSFRLDMGPGSVEAWLTRVVADELGITDDEGDGSVFDVDARELVLPTGRVGLTPLEYGVMAMLCERGGKPVSRADLLERVWGYDASTSSNVVDAVVLALRRKLGEHASVVETVRGTGYRYRA